MAALRAICVLMRRPVAIIPRHSAIMITPRRALPCVVESPEERTNWYAHKFAEEEKWFCIAANLLHKRRNGIQWTASDEKDASDIDERYKIHRDHDLDALIECEEHIVDEYHKAKSQVVKTQSASTRAESRLKDLTSKRKSPEWYANRSQTVDETIIGPRSLAPTGK